MAALSHNRRVSADGRRSGHGVDLTGAGRIRWRDPSLESAARRTKLAETAFRAEFADGIPYIERISKRPAFDKAIEMK